MIAIALWVASNTLGIPRAIAQDVLDGALQQGLFELRFEPADEALARDALVTLTEALDDLCPPLSRGDEPIRVALCGSPRAFRRFAGAYATPAVVGIARAEEGLIAVKTPRIAPPGTDFHGVLRHELIHVLLARTTDTANLPTWLNEGLAMHLSGEHRWNSTWRVAQMYLTGSIIPYRELPLSLREPGVESEFGDAYAQSLSLTRRLFAEIGDEGVWELLEAMREQSYGDALRAVAGMDPMDLFDNWRGSLWRVAAVSSIVSGFSVFQLMAVLTLVAWWRKRRRGRAIVQRWDEEDAERRTRRRPRDFLYPREDALERRDPPPPWTWED